jgi:hypothetical protein
MPRSVACGLVAVAAWASILGLVPGIARAEQSLPDTVARLRPSIVAVGTFLKMRSPPFAFLGTGFVVDDGTLIATCAHVVPDTPKSETGAVLTVVVQLAGTSEPQAREVTAIVLDVEHDLSRCCASPGPRCRIEARNSDIVRAGQSMRSPAFRSATRWDSIRLRIPASWRRATP